MPSKFAGGYIDALSSSCVISVDMRKYRRKETWRKLRRNAFSNSQLTSRWSVRAISKLVGSQGSLCFDSTGKGASFALHAVSTLWQNRRSRNITVLLLSQNSSPTASFAFCRHFGSTALQP